MRLKLSISSPTGLLTYPKNYSSIRKVSLLIFNLGEAPPTKTFVDQPITPTKKCLEFPVQTKKQKTDL